MPPNNPGIVRGMTQVEMAELLTPQAVAALLGIKEKLLAEWRSQGKGPDYLRLGHRTVRYHPDDLEVWVTEARVNQAENRAF